jgi:hypothetical protein
MTVSRTYEFKGLNLRQNDINRDPRYASDIENVNFDSNKQIRKRFGYDEDVDFGLNIYDTIKYRRGNELFGVSATALRRKNGSSFDTINFGGTLPSTGWSGYIDYMEHNGIIYIADTQGNEELFKYDGYNTYRAGVPSPNASTASAAGAKFYRVALGFMDAQGNIHWGDYDQFDNMAVGSIFTFDTFDGTEFYSKTGVSSGVVAITSGARTFNVLAGHTFVVGDVIYTTNTVSGDAIKLIVESFTATTITITATSIGTETVSYGAGEPLQRRHLVRLFVSDYATYGYELDIETIFDSSSPTDSVTSTGAVVPSVPMNDIYDTTIVRGLPPKCKYVKMYGASMVLGHRTEERSGSDSSELSKSTIYWSQPNTSIGTSVENFAPFDNDVIGQTSEGEISGLFESSDSLMVFKDSQVHYLNGILLGRQYRKRNMLATRIGCVSHKSIVEFSGGCLFMSERGIFYAANGSEPREISDIIEPLFTADTTGLDLSKTYSDLSVKNERVFFYIPATLPADDIVVVYDYYYKEWLKYKNIKANAGLVIFNDLMYHIDTQKLYAENSSFKDGTSNVSALYATGWDNGNAPTLRKKFVRAVLASIGAITSTIGIRTQINWDDTVDDTEEELDFSSEIQVDDVSLNTGKNYSMRTIFENSSNEDMLITGFELEYEPTQHKAKGED